MYIKCDAVSVSCSAVSVIAGRATKFPNMRGLSSQKFREPRPATPDTPMSGTWNATLLQGRRQMTGGTFQKGALLLLYRTVLHARVCQVPSSIYR